MATNNYETVFIAEPEIANDQVDQLVARIKQEVDSHSGTVTGEDRWGRRRLAYPIQGHREGFYVVMNYSAEPGAVDALEHFFKVTDSIVRHLTTRVIKKNKKFAPRRERPAGADLRRPASGRPGGSFRPRSEPAAPRPAAAEAAPSAAPAAPSPEAPEGAQPA